MVGASWSRYLNKCSHYVTPGAVALACNPSTQGAETGGGSQGPQPGLHCEFKASLGYIVSLKTTKTESNHTKKASVCSLVPHSRNGHSTPTPPTDLSFPGSSGMVPLKNLIVSTPRACWERQSKERDCSIYRILIQRA